MNRLDNLNTRSPKSVGSKSGGTTSKKGSAKSSVEQSGGKADKARTILAGALEVFTTQGYAAASMDRIAKTCGVSKPTLYTYFTNKEGLFVALIQQMTSSHRQSVFGILSTAETPLPPEQVLRKMAAMVTDNFSDNQTLLTLMRLVIGESERFPELSKRFVREVKKPMLESFVAYLETQPQLNLPDPMVAARMFSGSLVHYLVVQELLHGKDVLPLERDRMIDGLVHQMLAGAAHPPLTQGS